VSPRLRVSGIHPTAILKSKGEMTHKIVVLVTCASAKQARTIARALVERRLAACGNVIEAPVRSIYRWKGKVESAKEFLLILKSSRERFAAIESAVRKVHSYDVPEIIALAVVEGSRRYLDWISESVRGAKSRPHVSVSARRLW
jgi:periplasmic divalent cation tolerance protein